jgi:hypothetical protein
MTVIGKGMVRITDGADHGGAPFDTSNRAHGSISRAGKPSSFDPASSSLA